MKKETLEGLLAQAEELVTAYNQAIDDKDFEKMSELDDDIQETVGKYVALAKKEAFEECKKDPEGAMMAAIKRLTYDAIRINDIKDNETGTITRELTPCVKWIDPLQLQKYCVKGKSSTIGKQMHWELKIEKFNFLMTAWGLLEIGDDEGKKRLETSYAMHDIAKQIEMGKTPTSNTQILKMLQEVITAIIGEEYKATSHAVNYLKLIYGKRGKKACSVKFPNHTNMRQYVTDICHHIVTGKPFTGEFKEKKK